MKTTIQKLTLLSATFSFGLSAGPAQQVSPHEELKNCSAKIRGGGENDTATLRISIDVSNGPDWEVGLITQLLDRECKLSQGAKDLLDWEENDYLKKRSF